MSGVYQHPEKCGKAYFLVRTHSPAAVVEHIGCVLVELLEHRFVSHADLHV